MLQSLVDYSIAGCELQLEIDGHVNVLKGERERDEGEDDGDVLGSIQIRLHRIPKNSECGHETESQLIRS